ncbi:acetyl-CoA synthetase-like protein [Pisolithus albus]|nr:acetyl-CoA synthetase-like protein [Pisolithus albus]
MTYSPASFSPTPDSVPPPNVSYQQSQLQGAPVNYHPLGQRIQNLAYALIQAGIRPGDRVAVLSPNSSVFRSSYAHFGVIAARAILTPINTRLTSHEIAYIIDHSDAKLILVDHECSHLLPTSKVRAVFLSSGRRFSRERGWAGLDVETNEDTGAVLCYTCVYNSTLLYSDSPTGSYLAAIANAVEGQINRQSTYLWVLPMFHAAGWTFPWANVFGCATQIILRSVDYPLIWKHLLHSNVTHYCGAPTVQIGIVNDPAARPLTRPVTAVIAGSAPTPQVIGQLEQLGIIPVHVYGLTYTYGPFTRCYDHPFWSDLPLTERARLMARQGQSFATAQEVRVVYPPKHDDDQDMVDVPKDGKAIGEVVVRGNIVMKEYFKDPEATRKAFRGGHFNSGDLAVMYPDGVIAIVDRSKDIIISGGENASSLAIEREFISKWATDHAAFEVELKRHARERLPGFACPEWVQIVEELPKTSTGKILKSSLRKMVAKL